MSGKRKPKPLKGVVLTKVDGAMVALKLNLARLDPHDRHVYLAGAFSAVVLGDDLDTHQRIDFRARLRAAVVPS